MTEPGRIWWTAAEIAEAALPDMPGTKRRVNALAIRLGWQRAGATARRRKGKGGGWEYHWSLFPVAAQRKLVAEAAPAPAAPEQAHRDDAWAWFDGLPDGPKARAAKRLRVLQDVEALIAVGHDKSAAVAEITRLHSVAARTVWNWFGLVEGVREDDRLPFLAPRHRAAPRKPRGSGIDPEFAALIKADCLRPEEPSITACYDRSVRIAEARGIEIAPIHTVRRWLKDTISPATWVLARKGADALKRMYPAQERDKTALAPLEIVNADFHRFDVFVRWPTEDGPKVERAQMVAFQDIYSGRVLSWRLDRTPNARAVQLAIGDMVEQWGIPENVLLDNGREFAAKSITGGTPTRYRFTVRDDDLPGLLTSLGCRVIWATPYSGQSKPIERAFRDLCDRVAKHPRFAGAYTGNRPDAKPENYGNTAVDLDVFLEVLAEEMEQHNLRRGRRSEVACGRSFAEVFDEAYPKAPIRKATDAQRRMLLMGAEGGAAIRASSWRAAARPATSRTPTMCRSRL